MNSFNLLFWNARGLGNKPTLAHLKKLFSAHKISVAVLLEPMVSDAHISKLYSFCGVSNWLSNQSMGGQVWILWRQGVQVVPILSTNQSITVEISFPNKHFWVTAVYAKYLYIPRRELWHDLRMLRQRCSIPWLWGGDFNTLRHVSERLGGAPPLLRAMDDFNLCIEDCRMNDVCTSGSKFTWCNGQDGLRRSWQTLDRLLQSDDFIQLGGLKGRVLYREFSDHAPLLCSWDHSTYTGPRP